MSSCAVALSDKLTSNTEAQSIHPVVESVILPPDKVKSIGIDEFRR